MYIFLYFFGILILFNETEEAPNCDEILKPEHFKERKELGSFNSIFYYILPTACFVCSIPDCDYGDRTCAKWTFLYDIPLYHNFLEFGLSGRYFPQKGLVKVHLDLKCFFQIDIIPNFQNKRVSIKITECYEPKRKLYCTDEPFEINHECHFNNWYCVYISLAFYEKDKMHYAFSFRCSKFASSKFNSSNFIKIRRPECHFDKKKHKPWARLKFQQGRNLTHIGVPVILPCSPGGHVVDPETGRFVIGERCYTMFGSSNPKNTGIDFILRHFYQLNEDYLFGIKEINPTDLHPLYIRPNKTTIGREIMKPLIKKNLNRDNKVRELCEYVTPTQSPPRLKISLNESFLEENDTTILTEITRLPREEVELLPCQDILSEENLEERGRINTYITDMSCFVCSIPDCNFSQPECKKWSHLKPLYLYHNIIEFGLSGVYFPKKLIMLLHVNKKCYFNITANDENGFIIIGIEECLKSSNKCFKKEFNTSQEIFKNLYFCLYFAFAFTETNRIYYALSLQCPRPAGSQFDSNIYLTIDRRDCYFINSTEKMTADLKFLQNFDRTHNGVPVILPCSSGGYAVDKRKGRFLIEEPCWRTFFQSATPEFGIQFILKKIFDNNEDLLFETKYTDSAYPFPLYIKMDGESIKPSELIPKEVPNPDKGALIRDQCEYIPAIVRGQREAEITTGETFPISESTEGGGDSVSTDTAVTEESSTAVKVAEVQLLILVAVLVFIA